MLFYKTSKYYLCCSIKHLNITYSVSILPMNCHPFVKHLKITYDLKEIEIESIEKGLMRELERTFLLQQIDYSWKEHLQKISFLRDSIRWRAYGQKNPLTEYKKEAFNFFITMLTRIRHRVVYFVLRSKIILE